MTRPEVDGWDGEVPVSRFGAPRAPLSAAATVLRARAARAGVDLTEAAPCDLAAAALGADAWMALTGARTLDRPQQFGAGALAVLAAVLTRAAGQAGEDGEVPTWECPSAEWLLALAEEHRAWALELAGADADRVLRRVAWDLWAGGEGTVFSAYAALLTVSGQTLG